jgi:hypothetical protein
MAEARIDSGVCGMTTIVRATAAGRSVRVEFVSDCGYVQALAETLTEVDPFREISYRGEGPLTLRRAAEHLVHPACPVPSGTIKAIEVAAGLALPRDAHILPSKE